MYKAFLALLPAAPGPRLAVFQPICFLLRGGDPGPLPLVLGTGARGARAGPRRLSLAFSALLPSAPRPPPDTRGRRPPGARTTRLTDPLPPPPRRKCERTTCHDFAECQNAPARITFYQLNFQTGLLVPAQIFRISPVPVFAGDTIVLTITKGNEEGYFGTRRLNAYTGVVHLQRAVRQPRDFALDVEMKLWRQGSVTTFLAKMHIFFTAYA